MFVLSEKTVTKISPTFYVLLQESFWFIMEDNIRASLPMLLWLCVAWLLSIQETLADRSRSLGRTGVKTESPVLGSHKQAQCSAEAKIFLLWLSQSLDQRENYGSWNDCWCTIQTLVCRAMYCEMDLIHLQRISSPIDKHREQPKVHPEEFAL